MKKAININNRCPWLDTSKEDYVAYHDQEWGVPLYDDHRLFEFITLESAQAGLSWYTILKKRDGYRSAFKNFVVEEVAQMTEDDVERFSHLSDLAEVVHAHRCDDALVGHVDPHTVPTHGLDMGGPLIDEGDIEPGKSEVGRDRRSLRTGSEECNPGTAGRFLVHRFLSLLLTRNMAKGSHLSTQVAEGTCQCRSKLLN